MNLVHWGNDSWGDGTWYPESWGGTSGPVVDELLPNPAKTVRGVAPSRRLATSPLFWTAKHSADTEVITMDFTDILADMDEDAVIDSVEDWAIYVTRGEDEDFEDVLVDSPEVDEDEKQVSHMVAAGVSPCEYTMRCTVNVDIPGQLPQTVTMHATLPVIDY